MKLTRYETSLKQIAAELLSCMPCVQDVSGQRKTLQQYEENPDWQLYLCQAGNEFIGLIGIDLQEHTFCVHHICVDPAFRNEGIGNFMVEQVQQLHEPLALCTSSDTKEFLAKCWEKQQTI